MSSAIELMKKIMCLRFPWNIWVMIMGAVNMLGGLYFVRHPEGLATLAALMGAFGLMLLIYQRKGFVRLLGLGHIIFWIPLCVFLGLRYLQGYYIENSVLGSWVLLLLGVNIFSLLVDLCDLFRYLRGDRAEVPLS